MTASWFLAWWNLVFVVPFLLSLLYLGVYTVSGITFGEDLEAGDFDADGDVDLDSDLDADLDAEIEADLDADADVEVDADVNAELNVDADADIDAEADADADDGEPRELHGRGASAPPLWLAALSWLGLGRVPLSLLLMVLFMSWGVLGVLTNFTLADIVREWLVVFVSVPVAAVGSSMATRYIGGAMARWLPTSETFVWRREDLVGMQGEALFEITDRFGLAKIRAADGDLFHVPCRSAVGRSFIPKGETIVLGDYDQQAKLFVVTSCEAEELARPATSRKE